MSFEHSFGRIIRHYRAEIYIGGLQRETCMSHAPGCEFARTKAPPRPPKKKTDHAGQVNKCKLLAPRSQFPSYSPKELSLYGPELHAVPCAQKPATCLATSAIFQEPDLLRVYAMMLRFVPSKRPCTDVLFDYSLVGDHLPGHTVFYDLNIVTLHPVTQPSTTLIL